MALESPNILGAQHVSKVKAARHRPGSIQQPSNPSWQPDLDRSRSGRAQGPREATHMALIELNTNPTDRQLRQFAGLVLPLFALLVGAILWWRFGQTTAAWTVCVVAVVVGAAGVVYPALVRPVYLGWMYASYPIGWVIGHVVMGVVFFLVLTPIGLVMRFLGRDPLDRKFDESQASYWQRRDPPSDPSRYFRQF